MAVRMAEYMVDRLIRNTMQLEEEKRLRSSTTTVHGGSSSSSSQRKKTSWAARRKRQEELTEQTDVWSSVVDQYLCSERLSAMNGDHDNEGVCRQMYLRYCIVKAKRAECHYAIEDAYHWYVQAMSWMDKWTTLARGEIHGQSMYDAKMCQEGLEKKLALLQVVRLYREAEKKMKEGDEKGAIEVLEEVVVPLLEEKELGATDETLQMVSMLSEAYKKTGRVKEAWRCSTFVFCHLMQQLLLYGNQPLSIEQRFNKERNKAFFQYVSKINDSLDTFLLIQQQTKEAQGKKGVFFL
ncbi:hypothetical protein BDF20DRAFT_243409 [Mycotypha africana]|uniref:uncharacterized protein n=1 Tax=Mycotypha africana TaxID=64632 RepID=UPI00230128E2|nr:uncharacterized protein BDF20DRAFT_243409 [Mycotypha africana]KAI8967148.1 hypothetical protein BDF20DRAFT_243409 [Mycotypha africana]